MKTGIEILILSLLILMVSCENKAKYQDADSFSRSDFGEIKRLKGSLVEFDELIMQPTQLHIHDSLLITYNPKEEKLFHIFNLNSRKKIGECISMGQGPAEMIQPYFVINNENAVILFDMATSRISKFEVEEFISNPNPVPIQQITLKEQILSEVALLDGDVIGSPYRPGDQFYIFNQNGEKTGALGAFPVCAYNYSEAEKLDAYQSIITTNYSDKIAVCYIWTDLIDIYNKEGKLEKRIHGPEGFFSQFKEYSDGNVIISRPIKETQRDAYYSPVYAGEEFFVLFNGKFVNEKGYNLLSEQIFVFDWDGTPKRILSLDQGVFPMAVDAEHKKIYGISNDPEYHIVEFSYD